MDKFECNECGMSRRGFIKSGAIALLGFAIGPRFLERAVAATPGSRNKVLVAIFQRGAADGLSMVVPYGDTNYYSVRSSIAIPQPGRGPESAVDLDGFFGLNPALSPLKPIWDAGHLAIVHASGSPDGSRSHFDAQDYMESGLPGRSTPDGWLNRAMQAQPMPGQTAFRAVALSPVMPRTLRGTFPAVAMTDVNSFAIRDRGNNVAARGFEGMYDQTVNDVLHGTGRETFTAIKMLHDKIGKGPYQPANGAQYPRNPLGRSLGEIARLIKADVGLEVAFTDMGGWDTHANQGNGRGRLAANLRGFGDALAAFYQDLGDRMGDVVVLTMTEFGRMVKENGSGGTDHGHASCNFVMGGPVHGRKVYGQFPGLAPEQLYQGRDLAVTTDFRNVFSEICSSHLGIRDLRNVFPGFTPTAHLGLV
ncbi:MAG: DUF1501 domain-containing protein [Candidatus Xenobia bacterium]